MRSKKDHYKKSIIKFINISLKAKDDGQWKPFINLWFTELSDSVGKQFIKYKLNGNLWRGQKAQLIF